VASRDHDLRHKLNLVEQEKRSFQKKNKRLKELVEENKHLQAQIDKIKGQLAALTEARVAIN